MKSRDYEADFAWIKAARKAFVSFPEVAQDGILRALTVAAEGQKADIAKPLQGVGAGVFEVVLQRLRHPSIRAVLTAAARIEPDPFPSTPLTPRPSFTVRNLPAGTSPARAADLMEATADDACALKQRAGTRNRRHACAAHRAELTENRPHAERRRNHRRRRAQREGDQEPRHHAHPHR